MCSRAPLIKALFICFVLLLISLVNLNYRPAIDKQQKNFDNWVSSLVSQHRGDNKDLNVTVEVEAIDGNGSKLWRLLAAPEYISSTKLIRILTLAKEARLFSDGGQYPPDKNQLHVNIRFSSGNQEFQVSLNQEAVSKRIQTTTMLALMREYSKTKKQLQKTAR